MTACPPVEELLEFAAGKLTEASQASVEAHIDACVTCRASLSSLAKADAPNPSFGRYRLDSVLGSGGMGIVYRAWDPELARPIAIKVVRKAGADAQLRARLVREAQSLARLSHPNVCHCYDVGTEGEEVWVAMELVDGVTLRVWAVGKPYAALHEVLLGAAEGIAAAHASGLIHRDIKPENVLVTQAGRPVVTDFGLARIDTPVDPSGSTLSGDPVMTATGAIVGTPAYLAPEQLTGDPLDARVDQFAWAVMAWELLTGTRPFPVIAAIRLDAIRAGISAPGSLPRPIAAALTRAMALAPRDRFPSMRALIDALRAPPARRASTGALVAGAALLAAGAAVAAWKLRARDKAPAVMVTEAIALPDATVPIDASPPDASTPPAVAPAPKKSPPIAKTIPRGGSASASAQPPPPAQPPLRPLNNPKFSLSRLYAVLVMECKVPIDPRNPDPALGKYGIVDWGTVTRKEKVIAKLVDREWYMTLAEVKGTRGTYRFDLDFDVMGVLDVDVGAQIAVCPDPGRPEKFDTYELPASWSGGLDLLRAAVPLTGAPTLAQLAKLAPLHVDESKLAIAGRKGAWSVPPASHYLVWARPVAKDGARWEMRDWWLEVGDVPGKELVAEKQRAWFVIEPPTFEPGPAGEKPKLVAKVVRVLAEILPH